MGCSGSKPVATPQNKKAPTVSETIISPSPKRRKKIVESPPDVTGRDDQEDKDAVMWLRSNDVQALRKQMKR
jgi:hypothetical protein